MGIRSPRERYTEFPSADVEIRATTSTGLAGALKLRLVLCARFPVFLLLNATTAAIIDLSASPYRRRLPPKRTSTSLVVYCGTFHFRLSNSAYCPMRKNSRLRGAFTRQRSLVEVKASLSGSSSLVPLPSPHTLSTTHSERS